MFHVKHDTEFDRDEIASAAFAVFGDRLGRARVYRDLLATAGVERGLIGPRETERLWDRHILNCGVLATALPDDVRVVDVGSGAGLPGIPLALAGRTLRVTLLEPLERRHDFLREAIDALGLDVEVVRGRAEERTVVDAVGDADVVTSRAVAPLDRLARWSAPLIRSGGELVAIKGASAAEEIATHAGTVGKFGLTALRVETVGADTLSVPTTIVRARRVERPQKRRRTSR
ncbi:16S rRNA (guanine(527)-N(7))-methyltransferase RsmG [uncultured Williamsia sp.]|uniref:16S rRNA (guanine(527)-N(7))-methyltransferase RsmG n=1 Tax=uncultured Williamsia sp. TaxID=259311 RepID=UPI002610AE7D|nr:16S rRNA (guanine(527)-N(7))-methyltransferase RsmG [uncultured Williamsia sp.]